MAVALFAPPLEAWIRCVAPFYALTITFRKPKKNKKPKVQHESQRKHSTRYTHREPPGSSLQWLKLPRPSCVRVFVFPLVSCRSRAHPPNSIAAATSLLAVV